MGKDHPGLFDRAVVHGLPGPVSPSFEGQTAINRAAHFAGGRMIASLPPLGDKYSVECWVWNGIRSEPKKLAGVAVSLGSKEKDTDVLAVGDAPAAFNFPAAPADFRTWNHLLYVRDGGTARLYRNGKEVGQAEIPRAIKPERIVVGGLADGSHGFQGRIAEVAVYDRIMTADDAQARLKAAQGR